MRLISRYQGYICPGILVMIASSSSQLDTVADAWKRRLLTPPASCKISQVGLSSGCVVKPVMQSHQVDLPDMICLILARYVHFFFAIEMLIIEVTIEVEL